MMRHRLHAATVSTLRPFGRGGNIHFIGIGGIGMSALARYFRARGDEVSGSDIARSDITTALASEGVRIAIGHRATNLPQNCSLVVYSPAIRTDNTELRAARTYAVPVRPAEAVVGSLTREYRTLAVAGAHGKSTTTAMAALIWRRAGLDPTVMLGTLLREFGNSNFRRGRSRWLVLEADEYRAKFLRYHPEIAIVTNIDREHLDYFANLRRIEAAFFKFLLQIRRGGAAILNRDDPRLRRLGKRLHRLRPDIRMTWFSLRDRQAVALSKVLCIPGRHNVANALAVRAAARAAGISESVIRRALSRYRGSWRRFERVGTFAGAVLISDYGHHPTEIRATLAAARDAYPGRRIICVFQPHHYERTRALFSEFAAAFENCDKLFLLDIYEVAGRERRHRSAGITSATLRAAILRRGQDATRLANAALGRALRRTVHRGDVLIMVGAGSIGAMAEQLADSRGIKPSRSRNRRPPY